MLEGFFTEGQIRFLRIYLPVMAIVTLIGTLISAYLTYGIPPEFVHAVAMTGVCLGFISGAWFLLRQLAGKNPKLWFVRTYVSAAAVVWVLFMSWVTTL